MTTIAYRGGVMAADSRFTVSTDAGGSRYGSCIKLFRKEVKGEGSVILGLAGESEPGMMFLDWYGSGKEPPELFVHGDADFTALVLSKRGLFEFGKWCRGEKVNARKGYAVGSGCKAAMGAMYMGANARTAVRIACKIDSYSGGPVITMAL